MIWAATRYNELLFVCVKELVLFVSLGITFLSDTCTCSRGSCRQFNSLLTTLTAPLFTLLFLHSHSPQFINFDQHPSRFSSRNSLLSHTTDDNISTKCERYNTFSLSFPPVTRLSQIRRRKKEKARDDILSLSSDLHNTARRKKNNSRNATRYYCRSGRDRPDCSTADHEADNQNDGLGTRSAQDLGWIDTFRSGPNAPSWLDLLDHSGLCQPLFAIHQLSDYRTPQRHCLWRHAGDKVQLEPLPLCACCSIDLFRRDGWRLGSFHLAGQEGPCNPHQH